MSDSYYPPVLAFLLTAAALCAMLASGLAMQVAQDHPNHRSLHTQPVPRIGGFIMVPVILATWLLLPSTSELRVVAFSAGILCLISYCDDRFGLPIGLRFGSHLVAAIAFALGMKFPFLSVLIAVFVIVWCTNLYNFMDGANGLAGGMALIGFSCLAIAAIDGAPNLALACACIAAAAAGFLLFNFNPARVFLGDAGSVPLGFLVAAIGIIGWREALWDVWFPLVVFAPFIVDASFTLFRRILKRERIWEAHHDHYYQRLVRMGWSHRRLALAEYALMLTVAIAALVLRHAAQGVQLAGLLTLAASLASLMLVVDRRWTRYQRAQ